MNQHENDMTRVRKICPEIFCFANTKSVHIFNATRDENLFLKMAREKKSMAAPVLWDWAPFSFTEIIIYLSVGLFCTWSTKVRANVPWVFLVCNPWWEMRCCRTGPRIWGHHLNGKPNILLTRLEETINNNLKLQLALKQYNYAVG